MPNQKDANIAFFQENLSSWLQDEKLRNKFAVIHGKALRGTFDTFDAALRDAVARFPAEEFIIQQIIDANEVINFIRAAV